MRYSLILALLGAVLVAFGLVERGWLLLMIWLGCGFLALGVAHACGRHRLFGKRRDGTLALWNWAAFLPVLVYTYAVWHMVRLFSREPARSAVTDQLILGRRLLASEFDPQVDNYVDLTAEFAEPSAIRSSPSYFSFPLLDGAAPSPEALRAAVGRLRPGRTFIHCAQGHGRTGLFALAVLLDAGIVRNVEDGLRVLQTVRPGIVLSRAQQECIQRYAQQSPNPRLQDDASEAARA